MKELKKRLLFVLASDVDFFDTVEAFSYWTYPMVYWRLGSFRSASVRGAMGGLVRAGMAAKIVRGHEPQFRLTATGRDQLLSFFPTSGARRRWERMWRVVILQRGNLDQKSLRKLREILETLGFVALEAGVFVSPTAVTEELKRQLIGANLLRAVTVMETKRFVIGDDRAFAARVWGLDKWVERQKMLSSQSEELLDRVKRVKRLTDQQKIGYEKLTGAWFKLLLGVPGIPYKLLPSDWPHLETRQNMVKLAKMMRRTEEEQ